VAWLMVGAMAWAQTTAPGASPKKPKSDVFEAIKGLAGTWESTKTAPGEKPVQVIFKLTSAGTAVMETLGVGTDYEMIDMYTLDGDTLVMTHYCAMGNQPRLKATGIKDGVIKLNYVDGGNLKSRDQNHMDSLEISIKGDTLVEKWTSYENGKASGTDVFTLQRKK
jgi:hypothetical protein